MQLHVALANMVNRICYVPKPPHFFLSLDDSAMVGGKDGRLNSVGAYDVAAFNSRLVGLQIEVPGLFKNPISILKVDTKVVYSVSTRSRC